MNWHRHVSTNPFVLVTGALLQFSLTSCSPEGLSSPPPFIPYAPGDDAKVDRAVGNIQASQHGTVAPITSVTPSPFMIGFPAILTIKNYTECKLGFYFRGPSHRLLGVAAGQTERMSITEGKYEFAIDTRQCNGKLAPLYGEDILGAGHLYTFSISEEGTGVGYFEVNNDTGGVVTVRVAGAAYKVAPGSKDIELPQGTYTASVVAPCGTTVETIEVKQGSRYQGTYWCETHELSRSSTQDPENRFLRRPRANCLLRGPDAPRSNSFPNRIP